MIIQGIRYESDFEAKKLMIETGHRLDEKGYTLAKDGSMSVRVGPNAVWITTQDSENGALAQGDFIRVDLNGKSMNHSPDAIPPEDLEIHLKIYRENPEIQGVIHAYPVCAVVLEKDGRGLEVCSYTPSVRSLGKVTLIPAGDRAQVVAAAALAAKSDKGVLLENDGCLMWGTGIREAYRNIRLLDYCAQVRSRLGECRGTDAPGGIQRNAGALQGTEAPQVPGGGFAQAGPAQIPGLTGLYHPAGGIRTIAGGNPGTAKGARSAEGGYGTPAGNGNTAGTVKMSVSPKGPVKGPAQTDPAQIPGLTGLYHPAGGLRSVAGKGNAAQTGFVPQSCVQTDSIMPSRPVESGQSAGIIRSAAADPVKNSTMTEVIRKSMSKMGKGGL